jgi:RNA ligase (TIGR02306 family)
MERHRWRVKMCRFKGVPSECLIIKGAPDLPIGTDLSEALGVTKYEKPMPASMQSEAVDNFPSFIPKTDEPNFQTVPELVARMGSEPWYASEKADGTSCTVWNDTKGMHVCSRNWELKEFTESGKGNSYWETARKFKMEQIPQGFALQFEIVGPGIQVNPMGLKELEPRAFTLWDIEARRKITLSFLLNICLDLKIPLAPCVDIAYDGKLMSEDELRAMAEIKYPNGKNGEGIVVRALDSSWSFKVISLLYKD